MARRSGGPRWRTSLGALLALGAAACGHEQVARAALKAEGYTEVQLTPAEGGFDVKAARSGAPCEGPLKIRGAAGSYTVWHSLVCRAPE